MSSLNNLLDKHAIRRLQQQINRREINTKFSQWIQIDNDYQWGFSLLKFSKTTSLKYFNKNTVNEFLQFLEDNQDLALQAISHNRKNLSNSIFSIIRQGIKQEHENTISFSEPNDIIDLEQIWHSKYLKYSEYVFNHVINVPLYILGSIKNKNYVRETLSNRAKTLTRN